MLNAWISRDDILQLLSEIESRNKMVERIAFVREINRLKEHKKPQIKIKRTIDYKKETIDSIEQYRNDVKNRTRTSYFDIWLDKEDVKRMEGDKVVETISRRNDFGDSLLIELKNNLCVNEHDKNDFIKMNIVPIEYINELVQKSDRTIQRWQKDRKIIKETIYHFCLTYYDLQELLNYLKS